MWPHSSRNRAKRFIESQVGDSNRTKLKKEALHETHQRNALSQNGLGILAFLYSKEKMF